MILDDRNVVQPDLVFVASANRHIIRSAWIFGSPDLVVEILSQSSIVQDRYTKRTLYQRFKIPEYWIVDWKNAEIEVHTLADSGYAVFSTASGQGKVSSHVLPGLAVDVEEIMRAISA